MLEKKGPPCCLVGKASTATSATTVAPTATPVAWRWTVCMLTLSDAALLMALLEEEMVLEEDAVLAHDEEIQEDEMDIEVSGVDEEDPVDLREQTQVHGPELDDDHSDVDPHLDEHSHLLSSPLSEGDAALDMGSVHSAKVAPNKLSPALDDSQLGELRMAAIDEPIGEMDISIRSFLDGSGSIHHQLENDGRQVRSANFLDGQVESHLDSVDCADALPHEGASRTSKDVAMGVVTMNGLHIIAMIVDSTQEDRPNAAVPDLNGHAA